jgi:tetratricopeptide (TPR) repeat protein
LAEAYEMLGSRRVLPLEAAHAAAREAASKALELDDSLAEAHTAAGLVRMSCDWDWAGAERELQGALAINPACAEAHHMMAHLHETLGRFDAALAAMDKALGLEPVAPGLHSCLAHILYFARRFDAAVRQCQATLEIAPSFAGIYGWLGMADVLRGRTGEGLAALGEGLRQRPGDPRLTALLATAHALAGDHAAARRGLAELEGLARQRYVDPHLQAWPRVALGDFEDAFAWLRRAHEGHSEWLYLLRVDPLLDKLRPDPRFVSLLEAMRLA